MQASERRRVDWPLVLGDESPPIKVANSPKASKQLAFLTSEAMSAPSEETANRLLCHAIEFARNTIQLERAGIYLVDPHTQQMLGTFGTDAEGNTTDEHSLMYDCGEVDRQVFERAGAGFRWTVFEDFPLVTHTPTETRVLGHGWLACTAIMGPRGPLGMLFNDAALTHSPLDESKQWRTAILCSLLGKALWRCRAFLISNGVEAPKEQHPIVGRVTSLLVRDPTLTCEAIAKELRISSGRLARTFKREAKSSIVEYRNDLRLAGFLEKVDPEAGNLLAAALNSGFGSYAQFYRVFRARLGRCPRQYLSRNGSGMAAFEPRAALK